MKKLLSILVFLLASNAIGQAPLAPEPSVLLVDATGSVIGYPVAVSAISVKVAYRITGGSNDDLVLLTYTANNRNAGDPSVGEWNSEQGLDTVLFSQVNCQGQAYMRYPQPSLVPRFSAVTSDYQLWLSLPYAQRNQFSVLSQQTVANPGVYRCENLPASVGGPTPGLVPVFSTVRLGELFIRPLHLEPVTLRRRAVSH
jgi:hypothetical protein